jgi:hypothetical protein
MDRQTELMLKYGPKTVSYAANWGEKDEPLLRKYFEKSATLGQENNPMVIMFFQQMEHKWNDHIGALEIDGQVFEIVDLARTEDLPTVQGMQYSCRIIIKTGLSVWRYHGAGSSDLEARAYQDRLFGEISTRADMSIGAEGSITRVAETLKAIGIFAAAYPTLTVRESGIWNVPFGATGTMLNREVFSGSPITHTVNVAPFTVATDMLFASVTTYG